MTITSNYSFYDYAYLAQRTCKVLSSKELNKLHFHLGLITEIGEICDMYKKHIAYGKDFDLVNLGEEWADTCWYIANDMLLDKYDFSRITDAAIEARMNYLKMLKQEGVSDIEQFISFMKRVTNDGDESMEDVYLDWLAFGYVIFDNPEDWLKKNVLKLQNRFPEKFTEENAINRDTTKERQILEG